MSSSSRSRPTGTEIFEKGLKTNVLIRAFKRYTWTILIMFIITEDSF